MAALKSRTSFKGYAREWVQFSVKFTRRSSPSVFWDDTHPLSLGSITPNFYKFPAHTRSPLRQVQVYFVFVYFKTSNF